MDCRPLADRPGRAPARPATFMGRAALRTNRQSDDDADRRILPYQSARPSRDIGAPGGGRERRGRAAIRRRDRAHSPSGHLRAVVPRGFHVAPPAPPRTSEFAKFIAFIGAPGRTRTSTMLPLPDFESGASTNSATGAGGRNIAAKRGGSTGPASAECAPAKRAPFFRNEAQIRARARAGAQGQGCVLAHAPRSLIRSCGP